IAALFLKHHHGVLCEGDAFHHGLTSSILVWTECAPEDASVCSFFEYCPQADDRDFCHFWDQQLTQPCRELLRKTCSRRAGHRRLPEVFRYRPRPAAVLPAPRSKR